MMRKNKLFTPAVVALLLGIGSQANAQETVTTTVVRGDTLTTVEAPPAQPTTRSVDDQVWGAIKSTEGYDQIPDDALLPITAEQAEELITKLILEARKPYVEAAYRDSVLTAFKLETLKRRALDQALARTYTDPLERRLDQMERLIYALLLSKGDLSPEVINQLLGGTSATPYLVQPATAVAAPDSVATNQVPATNLVAPRKSPVTPEEAIALQPGLSNKEIDLYMSVAYFGFDSSVLSDETIKTLDNVVAWMKENDLRVSLRGYASPEGRMSYNNKLSGRRVNAVADYLVQQGIARDRLEVIPSGIDSMKDTKSKYPQGRRVEIRPILY